ncbi:lutropin-choriogonadotropic hormone receptor-like [Montipora capricornis]|uniref:lutropin-choriogonadotropic hormone receptor-like n=1 Tax=Montipora capricornis TaxID=246305 RepID=UPI0035F1F00C
MLINASPASRSLDMVDLSCGMVILLSVLVFVHFGVIHGETLERNKTDWRPCSHGCNCSQVDDYTVAKCDVSTVKLRETFVLPKNTSVLDLSRNGLVEVPYFVLNKSTNILALLLSGNNIENLSETSFPLLPHLLCLDLSFNSLREWEGNISPTFPSLESVDFEGNPLYFPGSNLFRLDSLIKVLGIKWNAQCGECNLINTEFLSSLNESELFCRVDAEEYEFAEEIKYGKSLFFTEKGFSPQCICEKENCQSVEISMPYDRTLNTLPRKLFYVEYMFGVIALMLNVLVVFICFGSISLRKSTSFIFIGNIGFCDAMMGVYSILLGRFTVYEFIVNTEKYPDIDVFVNSYCTVMGAIFTTAQITSVSTSFLATLERYLSIVHCMKPELRLRKSVALLCLAGIWCVAIGYSLLAVFQVGGLRYHGEFTCMMPFTDGPEIWDTSMTGLAVTCSLVVFYLVSFALYFHLFVYVKKTEISAGVKRKATLAKNISLMVFTNFLFFIIPMVCTLLFVYRYSELAEAFKVDTLKELRIYFIMLSWLPVVLLSLNSCLNPFLCAFRHPKFQKELQALVDKFNCKCEKQSEQQPSNVWTLTTTKGFELNSTVAFRNEAFLEQYRSAGSLDAL